MIEGYASQIRFDGSQPQRTPIRSDCNAEAAMVLAMSGDERGHTVASNLLDYVFGPEMESLGRSDPKHPAFGLIAWGAISPAWMIANYGDDDARVMLSTILASAAMKSDRWDVNISGRCAICATGKLGFRGDRIDIALEHRMEAYRSLATNARAFRIVPVGVLPLGVRAGEPEFWRRPTGSGDGGMRKQWRWMDRSGERMLCLSWLVPSIHPSTAMADHVANDLLDAQQPAARQERRRAAVFRFPNPTTYGTANH
jgi:hypothetical protein